MTTTRDDDSLAKPSRVPKLFMTFVVVCVALALAAIRLRREQSAESYTQRADTPAGGTPLWMSPPFSATDQLGRTLTRESLGGAPYVVDFVFTQCSTACPTLTAKLVRLQHRTLGRTLRFVSFSVDPDHDNAEVLRDYARRWNPRETRWHLLTARRQALAPVLAGFRVTVRETSDPNDRLVHSNTFSLVDGLGRVRGVYDSADPRDLDRLTRDALAISAPGDVPPPSLHVDYESLGCGGCHDRPETAPRLANLRSATRTMTDGRRLAVDASYLRRALLEPGMDVVRGYEPTMPSYREQLTNEQVQQLVEALLNGSSQDESASVDAPAVIDPVCDMRVRTSPETPQLVHAGRAVYFCSDACRRAFEQNPAHYVVTRAAP